jgi:AcrR family transcriptional regulator
MYKPGMPRLAELPTRDRLLAAGQALARRQGLRALTVRAVAARAQVNLGSLSTTSATATPSWAS